MQVVASGPGRGTESTYECAGCSRTFVVDSPAQAFFTALASGLALAIGAAMLASASGQGIGAWFCALAVALLGVGGIALFIARLVARVRHPVTPLPES